MLRLVLLLLPLALLPACAEDDRSGPPASADPGSAPPNLGPDSLRHDFTARGLYLGAVYDSAAAVISHEAIPGFMGAMRMQLRVDRPAELRGLTEGDKIRFWLADDGDGYRVSRVEKLPPDTPLQLSDFGADAVPPEASVDAEQ